MVEPGVWPWHLVVFLGMGFDAWCLISRLVSLGRFGRCMPSQVRWFVVRMGAIDLLQEFAAPGGSVENLGDG